MAGQAEAGNVILVRDSWNEDFVDGQSRPRYCSMGTGTMTLTQIRFADGGTCSINGSNVHLQAGGSMASPSAPD